MAIMTCPRCGGGGRVWEGDANTTAGQQEVICPSCGGSGYVTDTLSVVITEKQKEVIENGYPSREGVHYFACPHCGKPIEAEIGHYIVFPQSARRI